MSKNTIKDRGESSKTVVVELTSAVVIAGKIIHAGDLVEVTKLEAADLVQRGRGTVVGSDDVDDFEDDDQTDADQTVDETAQDVASDVTNTQTADDAPQAADATQKPATGRKRNK